MLEFPSDRPWARAAGVAALAIALVVTALSLGGASLPGLPVGGEEPAAPPDDLPGCPASGAIPEPATLPRAEAATLCALNRERAGHGLAPFAGDARLRAAARRHSRDMARRHFFEHRNPDGASPADRVRAAGFPASASTAENIAWGSEAAATPVEIVEGWMDSPGHRANILHPRLTAIGVGIAAGAAEPGAPGRSAVYTTSFGGR